MDKNQSGFQLGDSTYYQIQFSKICAYRKLLIRSDTSVSFFIQTEDIKKLKNML